MSRHIMYVRENSHQGICPMCGKKLQLGEVEVVGNCEASIVREILACPKCFRRSILLQERFKGFYGVDPEAPLR